MSKNKKGRPLSSPLVRDNIVTFRLNSKELDALNNWTWRYDVGISNTLRDLLMIHSIIPDSWLLSYINDQTRSL